MFLPTYLKRGMQIHCVYASVIMLDSLQPMNVEDVFEHIPVESLKQYLVRKGHHGMCIKFSNSPCFL